MLITNVLFFVHTYVYLIATVISTLTISQGNDFAKSAARYREIQADIVTSGQFADTLM